MSKIIRPILHVTMCELDLLRPYKSWHLSFYMQPFDEGRVEDPTYECKILVDGKWTREEYGATAELAIRRALGEDV